jgi:hypothetical protein
VAPGATSLETQTKNSGVQLAGARGPLAEFTALVPFTAETTAGSVKGQALWQVTLVETSGVWAMEAISLRSVL